MEFENAVPIFLWSLVTVQLLTVTGIILLKSKRTLIGLMGDSSSLLIIGYFTMTQFTFMQTNSPTLLQFVGILALLFVILFIRDILKYIEEIKQNQTTIE